MPLKTIKQDEAEGLGFVLDPSLVLYLPLYQLDGASFMSRDAYGHLCAVTGALWRPQGRWFDKLDDDINCGSAASIDNIWDSGGTLEAWVNPASDGETDVGRIFDKEFWILRVKSEVAGMMVIQFQCLFNTTNGVWDTSTAVLPINAWFLISVTYNSSNVANDPVIYLNGVSTPITETSTPVGTRRDEAANILQIGGYGGLATWDGYIGEVRLYKARILTASEAMNNYLATKWRYS